MIKRIVSLLILLFFIFCNQLSAQTNEWSKHKAKEWFKTEDWLGDLKLRPHTSVNVQEFAKQYNANKDYWEEAFTFLRNNDLQKLPKGKYPIDGDNVFASVTEDSTKDFENTNWESHRKYIDLQYVIEGAEKMGVCPVKDATVTNEYSEKKDIANYNAKGKIYPSLPGTFFIFFPTEAHRPSITTGGNKPDKKIVIKIRAAD